MASAGPKSLIVTLPWCGPLAAQSPPDRPDRPNIVFVLADDLGWSHVGFQGAGFYESPHLDRLAAEGMVFRRA